MIGLMSRHDLAEGIDRSLNQANTIFQNNTAERIKFDPCLERDFVKLTNSINYYLALDEWYFEPITEK